MSKEEQRRRNINMRERLKRYNVVKWANDFIKELDTIKRTQEVLNARHLDTGNRKRIIEEFKKENKRLFDYDGTLSFCKQTGARGSDKGPASSGIAGYAGTKLV
jgi:trehalose 6-phosphate synthase/phosphatase